MSHQSRTSFKVAPSYLAELDEIMTGAETLRGCSCDNGNAEVGRVVEPIEHLTHFQVAFEGYRVHLSFAVDCDEENIVGWVRE